MIYLNNLLWLFVLLFAIIGFYRGAAKELLVTISALVGLFILSLLELTEFFQTEVALMQDGQVLFWVRFAIFGFLILIGYQTPGINIPVKSQLTANDKVEKFAGIIIGAVNGFLTAGTLWYFLHEAGYPGFVQEPNAAVNADLAAKALKLVEFLPPAWLEGTVLYAMVGVLIVIILIMIV
ncbi:MAG: hypothetical protein JW750_01440 [Anaerolineaceae bacterium]|nr:hypothetical protein [Anaerolineaceae bacterium]